MDTELHHVSDAIRDVEKALLLAPTMGMDITHRSGCLLPKH
jgi:hypothetical protein